MELIADLNNASRDGTLRIPHESGVSEGQGVTVRDLFELDAQFNATVLEVERHVVTVRMEGSS